MTATQPMYRVASEDIRSMHFGLGTGSHHQGQTSAPAGIAHAWDVRAKTTLCGLLVVPGTQPRLHLFANRYWSNSVDPRCRACLERAPL